MLFILPAILGFNLITPSQENLTTGSSSAHLEFYPVAYSYTNNKGDIKQNTFKNISYRNTEKDFYTNIMDFSLHLHPQSWGPWYFSFGRTTYAKSGVFVLELGHRWDDLSVGGRVGISTESGDFDTGVDTDSPYTFSSELKRDSMYTFGLKIGYEYKLDEKTTVNPRLIYTKYNFNSDEGPREKRRNAEVKRDYYTIGTSVWYELNQLIDLGCALDLSYAKSNREVTDKGATETSYSIDSTLTVVQAHIIQARLKF